MEQTEQQAHLTLTGAELIAHKLRDCGVRHAFGIISIHNMPGEIGVAIASTGPGTTNTVTGLYEAAYANSRLLVITGQAETRYYGKGMGYVHEAEKQLPMLATVARRVESPRTVEQIGPLFDAVVNDMSSGRWQPGALEIPIDLQYAKVVSSAADAVAIAPTTSAVQNNQIDRAAELIKGTTRRVLLVGGGAMDAGAEVLAFAESLGAPILTTPNGRGAGWCLKAMSFV